MTAQALVQQLQTLGMTQQEIADETGIAQPTVSKILRGEVADVLSRNYFALEDALKRRQSATPKVKTAKAGA